ncbi:MAG TPA: FAD-binding molybdopterin dehydrogenase [Micrococcales bacterium]|uniref:FAD-binding molybdopterin dehydrogenase n=1 Tax=Miniimonas arenae TaxID=676201 RepID=A0A5C5BHA1_9MICO|nr:FAD binding domain-containing protein [Miniimonas arenae]TNU76974.1 FAD-binding molybdopterin dehydrogenase [Miniimonas arenae]HCX85030.1 FAD-binding molybdopterin dehydrogenase [Micrococcales bacterium]
MDLTAVREYRVARTRADLALAPGEVLLAGGTWLYSEANTHVTGLVDLTGMDWVPYERTPDGLTVAATCTIAELLRAEPDPAWRAWPLLDAAANALLASWKVWNVATVGGNVARSFAAGALIAWAVTLDAQALVWRADGTEARLAVEHLVTGNGTNALDGGVLRALEVPDRALRGRTALRKIALNALGRSGAVVTGRADDDGARTYVVTGAVERPAVLRYPSPVPADRLRTDVDALAGWFTDAHGSADWRRAVAAELAVRVRADLEDAS